MTGDVHDASDPVSLADLHVERPWRAAEQLSVRQNREDEALTLRVDGVVDTITTPQLAVYLEIAFSTGPEVLIVDLTGVTFLAAAGINLLVNVQRLTEGFTTELRVVATGPITDRPLRVLGVDSVLQLYNSPSSAMLDLSLGDASDAQ